jgi:LEA14-like dessication related protein
MDRSPSRRTLLLAGSFAVVFLVTVAVGVSTVTAMVAHVEASATLAATTEDVSPTEADSRLDVTVAVENPTDAPLSVSSAWIQVYDDGEAVAGDAGIGFDEFVVPPGERRTVVLSATIDAEDPEAVREAARNGELDAKGRFEARIVERSLTLSIEAGADA